MKLLSRVRLFATTGTVAYQAPSMGFSRQEYRSALPSPSPEDLPDPGIESRSPVLQADAFRSEPPGSTLIDSAFQIKDREQTELKNTQVQEINFKYKIKIKLYVKERYHATLNRRYLFYYQN